MLSGNVHPFGEELARGGARDATRNRSILFLLFPEFASLNASFALAKTLQREGYHIIYLGGERFRYHVVRQGFEYTSLSIDRTYSEKCESALNDPLWWRRHRLHITASLELYEALWRSMRDWLNNNPIDLLLLDPVMWIDALPFVERKISIVNLNTTLASRPNVNVPPVFSRKIPRREESFFGKGHNLCLWVATRLGSKAQLSLWAERAKALLFALPFGGIISKASSAVKHHGASLSWSEYGHRLAAPEFVLCPKTIDFPGSTRADKVYVGSGIDPERVDDPFDWRSINKNQRLLYCSLGTYSRHYPFSQRFFRILIDLLRSQTELQAIIQVGDSLKPEEFESLPPHILVVDTAPQLQILEHADLFITHGGFSSIREAVYFGVPMLVFPCWLDQAGNSARVVFHGLGIRGDIKTIDQSTLGDMLRNLQNGHFQTSISNISRSARARESCIAGVEWISDHFSLNGS